MTVITLIGDYKQHVFGTFSLSHPERTVQNHCSPILRWSTSCPPSLAAISAGLLHVQDIFSDVALLTIPLLLL